MSSGSSRDQADRRDEHAEWLESVDGLIRARGARAAARILDDVSEFARGRGVPTGGRTPYRNTLPAGLGRHLSTRASTLTLWEVGSQHFVRGRRAASAPVVPGDQVFVQGHASPGTYARPFLEGRLTSEQRDQLARSIQASFVGLGTDGYGVSDTREELRAHFGADADGIRAAAARIAGNPTTSRPMTAHPHHPRSSHGLVA